jgi:hypothetical protein
MTPAEEAYVVEKAYVPEHIVSLMTLISRGDAFLIEDYLGFAKDNWLIVVGYPFERPFSAESCGRVVERVVQIHKPEVLRFIGPELPPALQDHCAERQSDEYYLLDIERTAPSPSLLRAVAKAGQSITVERGRTFSQEHEKLVVEFLRQTEMTPRVRALYLAMPGYVGRSPTAWTLSARDKRGRLCAFFVVDLGAASFSTFLLGARSRRHDTPHASDLLFLEMIKLTREFGKTVINLGLGVHAGIRRFKEKWGGRPALRYEFCERWYGTARKVSLWAALMDRL